MSHRVFTFLNRRLRTLSLANTTHKRRRHSLRAQSVIMTVRHNLTNVTTNHRRSRYFLNTIGVFLYLRRRLQRRLRNMVLRNTNQTIPRFREMRLVQGENRVTHLSTGNHAVNNLNNLLRGLLQVVDRVLPRSNDDRLKMVRHASYLSVRL